MVSTADRTMHAVLEDISKLAIDKAVENGAVRESVKIAEMDAIPLQVLLDVSPSVSSPTKFSISQTSLV